MHVATRVLPFAMSTFLASTTHGVEMALERPARPAADGQTRARARSSPHPSVSTPGGRASSERSSTTPTQRLSTSGQVGGSGWRSTARKPGEFELSQKNMQTHATRVWLQQQQHKIKKKATCFRIFNIRPPAQKEGKAPTKSRMPSAINIVTFCMAAGGLSL